VFESFVSNLKESLQNEGIATEVKGYPGYVGMSDKGKVLQGDEVPKNKTYAFNMSGYFDFKAFF
jgi:hypothetical protein